jgi:adenine-specific DNA-methyltransferase
MCQHNQLRPYLRQAKSSWIPNRVFTARDRDTRYGQFIVNAEEPYSKWKIVTLANAFANSLGLSVKDARKLAKDEPTRLDDFVLNNAKCVVRTARPDYKGVSEAARDVIDLSKSRPREILRLERQDHSDMYFQNGERILFYADKLKLVDGTYVAGEPLTTLWDDILSNNLHKEGGIDFPKGKKPEALIKRCLELSTSPGDWVLDSFAGSGTTGAVAHKLFRRWIMVELGEHCHTHVIPRLKRVIDGLDGGVVTNASGWKGGGGFRYYKLAPSLLEQDEFGNWIINKKYNAAMLAEALCKLEGFTYAPSEDTYWQHGHSTETDFIYVTTQTLSREQLQKLSDEVGSQRSLLICCAAFRVKKLDDFPNLTLKKIPMAVMAKCEWGKDDYSLEINALPNAPERQSEQLVELTKDLPKSKRKARKSVDQQSLLFAMEDAE